MLTIDPHPLLDAVVFTATLAAPLGEVATTDEIRRLFAIDAGLTLGASGRPSAPSAPNPGAPFSSDEAVRAAVRDLLRHGGYKPTGRGKPSSEYLIRAVSENALGSINLVVDACNVVSLHSGLPISVIDLDRAKEPLRIGVAKPGEKYVFNASGQEIDVGGLLCLFDADGPTANGVKDAQRTKTHAGTRRTLTVVWGTKTLPGRAKKAAELYRKLLEDAGAKTEAVIG